MLNHPRKALANAFYGRHHETLPVRAQPLAISFSGIHDSKIGGFEQVSASPYVVLDAYFPENDALTDQRHAKVVPAEDIRLRGKR